MEFFRHLGVLPVSIFKELVIVRAASNRAREGFLRWVGEDRERKGRREEGQERSVEDEKENRSLKF